MFSIYELPSLLIYCLVISFILGASMGSFLNCAAYRMAHGQSVVKGRSICPECGHFLSFLDLFPLISWLMLRGKCRYCGCKVSIRYPLTELFFAMMTVICLLRFDFTLECLRNWVFLGILFTLSLVDLEATIIPDSCHLAAIAVWLLTSPFLMTGMKEFLYHVGAAFLFLFSILAISLIMDRILGRDSMGGGDIKLYGVVALYLGFTGSLFSLFLSCIIGLTFAAIGKKYGEGRSEEFPFGPSIALAASLVLLFGQGLIKWYTGLI